jgi:hypothetical protein
MTDQKCWEEVRQHSGVSLADQSVKYEKAFTPWGKNVATKIPLANQVKTFEAELISITAATDILQLQNVLIIRNVNEFQLRDNPTQREFAVILDDFRRWCYMVKDHIDGDCDIYLSWIEKVISAAQQKFDLLRRRL